MDCKVVNELLLQFKNSIEQEKKGETNGSRCYDHDVQDNSEPFTQHLTAISKHSSLRTPALIRRALKESSAGLPESKPMRTMTQEARHQSYVDILEKTFSKSRSRDTERQSRAQRSTLSKAVIADRQEAVETQTATSSPASLRSSVTSAQHFAIPEPSCIDQNEISLDRSKLLLSPNPEPTFGAPVEPWSYKSELTYKKTRQQFYDDFNYSPTPLEEADMSLEMFPETNHEQQTFCEQHEQPVKARGVKLDVITPEELTYEMNIRNTQAISSRVDLSFNQHGAESKGQSEADSSDLVIGAGIQDTLLEQETLIGTLKARLMKKDAEIIQLTVDLEKVKARADSIGE